MHSAWFTRTFLRVLKFLEMKEGEPILQNISIIWSALLYFNLKSSMDRHSLSFIRFQSFLHESGVLFSESWNFYKLKRVDLISGGNQFCRMSQLFGSLFSVISAWIRSTFLGVLKFLQIKEGGSNFRGEPILQNVWITWSPLLYFNFKSFPDPNSS